MKMWVTCDLIMRRINVRHKLRHRVATINKWYSHTAQCSLCLEWYNVNNEQKRFCPDYYLIVLCHFTFCRRLLSIVELSVYFWYPFNKQTACVLGSFYHWNSWLSTFEPNKYLSTERSRQNNCLLMSQISISAVPRTGKHTIEVPHSFSNFIICWSFRLLNTVYF